MSRLRVLLARLRSALRRDHADADLRAEIASHLDEAAEEFERRGLSPDAARQEALRHFGGVAWTEERHRELRVVAWLGDLLQDVRYAARSFAKSPGFTFVTVLTLALGIGANTTMFTLLDAVVFKPLPVAAPDELVALYENGPEGPADAIGGTGRFLRFSYPRFERLRRALGAAGTLVAVTRNSRMALRLPGDPAAHFVQVQMVSGDYFSTLGVLPARGRTLTSEDVRLDREAPVAVVAHNFWQSRLSGSEDVVGRVITVNGVAITVVGVAPRWFAGLWTDNEAELWLPLSLQQTLRYENNSSSYLRIDPKRPWFAQDGIAWLNLVARLPQAHRAVATPQLQAANRDGLVDLAAQFQNPKGRADMLAHSLVVEPIAHGFSGLRVRFGDALLALTALVALVLLVTCANVANLLLARAAARARDLAIRISLGATTGRLVRQCLTESLMLALFGGAAGVLFSAWASHFLARQVIGTSGTLPMVFDAGVRVLVYATAVSVSAAVVFGLVPAFRAVVAGRRAALAPNQRQIVGAATLRGMGSLVAMQLALSVVLVAAALLLGRTLINFTRIDPGFAIDRLANVSIQPIDSGYADDQMSALAGRLVDAARAVPGVRSAVVARCGLIAGCSSSSGFRIEGGDDAVTFYENWVGGGYFSTVGISIVAGREFDERDGARGARVAIVNETIARRFFGGSSPLGRRIGFSQADIEIVGVARDARTQTLHEPPVPMVYFPLDQRTPNRFTAPTSLDVRLAADPRGVLPGLRDSLRRAEPNLLLGDVVLMEARVERDLTRERLVAYLSISFAVLTLLLASIGVYGVLAYGVARRTTEIGVRIALGARRSSVVRLIAGQSAMIVAVGIGAGLFGALAAARSFSGMLFGVEPLDPMTFVLVIVVFMIVTSLAAFIPARRATRVEPAIALRGDS